MAAPAFCTGTVKRITFFNPENGYFVAAIQPENVSTEIVVTGTAPAVHVGAVIKAKGTWITSAQWGRQFKASELSLDRPTDKESLVRYLSSSINGVGPSLAQKLVDAFGPEVFKVLEREPERLKSVPGVGAKRAAEVLRSVEEQRESRQIMLFLTRCGLGPAMANKVIQGFAAKGGLQQSISENPYILIGAVRGLGFLRADDAAQRLGLPKDSPYRLRAGVRHVLLEAEGEGSCGLPRDRLLDAACALLDADAVEVGAALQYELKSTQGCAITALDGDGVECVFSRSLYAAEKELANRLVSHARSPMKQPFRDVHAAILEAEIEAAGVPLVEQQRQAIAMALSHKVCVITGGPGVGKTTVTKTLLHAFSEAGLETLLAAPTGKAAQRASEATGHEATTIHRLLGFKGGGFAHDAESPLEADVVVLDEMSIVGVRLALAVVRALAPHTRLVLIGDEDQLPSVDAGKVLADIIGAKLADLIPTLKLDKIFRQAAGSQIIVNAHAINKGELPATEYVSGSDFVCLPYNVNPKASDEEKQAAAQSMQDDLVRAAQGLWKRNFDPMVDLQVLSPMKRGKLGTEELNLRLQAALNPNPSEVIEVKGVRWGVGDKIIQLRNNYNKGVFNGDIGFIESIDRASRSITAAFSVGVVSFNSEELADLGLAYAITVHKSQGSEAPVVIMPLHTSHYTMLKRNLLYTGITRAKKLCVLFATPWAIKQAVQTTQADDRFTRLKAALRQAANTSYTEAT